MNQTIQNRQVVTACHVCKGPKIHYLFSISGQRVVRCDDCGLMFLNSHPLEDELSQNIDADCFWGSKIGSRTESSNYNKLAIAKLYLQEISRYRGARKGSLLEIGCGEGQFLVAAEGEGWTVTGIDGSTTNIATVRQKLKQGEVFAGDVNQARLPADRFDVCVVSNVLQTVRSPMTFLQEVHRVLKPGGTLVVRLPCMDSKSAQGQQHIRTVFSPENLTYFDHQTIQTALFKSGFRKITIQPDEPRMDSDNVANNTGRFSMTIVGSIMDRIARMFTREIRLNSTRKISNSMLAFSEKTELRAQPMLSVVVPAYNEAGTFGDLMEVLLEKELHGIDMEIIVVESNSTDGTRELALKYRNHPRVKLVLEDRACGKGHAVRAGLKEAEGDYVLIQDADLEYDLEDYDVLLEQLIAGRSAFVLGARHGGHNVLKMRQFSGQFGLSLFLNLGHCFFAALLNVLFSQTLRDPFTMFKVFRRDCLHGLEFSCNRFDFDFELLIKLIRKGYQPVEIPVNYRSRSFKAGKKVRVFRDPVMWMMAIFRLRFAYLRPSPEVEHQQQQHALPLRICKPASDIISPRTFSKAHAFAVSEVSRN